MDIRASRAATRNRNRPSRWQIIGAGAAALVAPLVGVLALRPTGPPVDTSAHATASSSASAIAPGPAAARPVTAPASDLARIADRLVAAPYETHAHTGSFEYTDIRIWETTTDPTGNPADTARTVASIRRIRSWTNAVDAGRAYAVDEARGCPAEDQNWTDQPSSPWGGPLSSDPGAVRRQLLGPPPNDGIDLFGQIGELYIYRIVPLATRRGLLTMLARTPHLTVQRNVRDAAGRLGIAVTDTAGPAIPAPGRPFHRTLIFDPATGDLLARVTTDATSTPDYATPPGRGYALYLAREYTPNVRTPKPDCIR